MTADAHGNVAGKRLVILGCGYVGAEMARQAVARGLRVTALTRNPAKAAALAAAGVDAVVADLTHESWHGRIAGGADFALNCVSSGGGGIEAYRRSYADGMRSVLEWTGKMGAPATLVYTSSTSVYPQGGGARVDESAVTEGGHDRAAILLEAESLFMRATGAARRRFVLRLAGIYGPGRHHLVEQVRAGEVSGRADGHLNLIHRDDVVAAVWAAFAAPEPVADGTFNVADDGAATRGEIVAWLSDRLGVPRPRFTGQPVGARRAVTPDRIIDNGRIKRELGWQPLFRTFREGYAGMPGAL
jgi:nucleoside-diphosphate-sugar epimerase